MAGQLTTIRLSRGDSQPWGFRLQGGKDWALPLSVSKVNPGSLADQGGLCVGDIIVKICGQNAEVMQHKEAQDVILRAGNNLDISLLKGGTSTWQPKVVPIANAPAKPRPASGIFEPQPVTKTSLAHNQTAQAPAGTSHNKTPAPFATFGTSSLPLVNKQYNSPINLYSMRNIKDTIDAHSELLAPGVKGINFMKPETPVNTHSAVYQAILEEEAKSKGASPTPIQGNPAHGTHSPQPRIGFPAHSMLKHAEAPAPVPKPSAAPDSAPGQNTCAECGRLIVGVFCRINDKSFHAECFRCATCGNSLKNVGHFNINDKLYCDVHASQAARIANRSSVYEPLAVNPNSGFPLNASHGQNAFQQQSAPFIPQPSGRVSPGLAQAVSATPWHGSQNYHHVDAPISPVPGQTGGFSLLAKPSAPIQVPKFEPKSGLNPLYQPTPTPFSSFAQNSNADAVSRPVPVAPPNASKFSWPPKTSPAPVSSETHSQPVAYRPSVGNQSVSTNDKASTGSVIRESVIVESSEISSFEQTTSSSSNLQRDSVGPERTNGQSIKLQPHDSLPDRVASDVLSAALPVAAAKLSSPSPNPVAPDPAFPAFCLTNPPAPRHSELNFNPLTTGSGVTPPQSSLTEKPAPNTAPAPWARPAAPSSGLPHRPFPPSAPSSTSSSSIPPPGKSSVAGSKESPKRGRGQLKPSASPGTRIPVCGACQIPVRGPFIVALGKTWCPEHFNCANNQCRRSLQEIGFVEEQGQLYCEGCFEQYLAPICAKCNTRIKGDCLLALDRQWHPQCFACSYCKNAFGNNSFYLEDGQPYCEKDWNELFTTKCVSCGFPIEAGDRWVEALNNNYHSQCFKCTVCQTNLEGQSFFAKGGRPFCKLHAR